MFVWFKRRFTKLRLFDLILILAGLSVVLSIFILLLRSRKKIKTVIKVNEEFLTSQYKGTSVWYAQLFHPGMKEKNTFGQVEAQVTKVTSFDLDPNRKTIYLNLDLQAVYSPGMGQYTYKGKNILIGSTIQLYLDDLSVDGLIVDMEGYVKPYRQVKLKVSTLNRDLEPFVPAAIHIGDQMKDSTDKVLLTVDSQDVSDADKVVITYTGDVLLKKDPIKKDMRLVLNISGYQVGNRYYFFDNIPVLIDGVIPIHLQKTIIYPVITAIDLVK